MHVVFFLIENLMVIFAGILTMAGSTSTLKGLGLGWLITASLSLYDTHRKNRD